MQVILYFEPGIKTQTSQDWGVETVLLLRSAMDWADRLQLVKWLKIVGNLVRRLKETI